MLQRCARIRRIEKAGRVARWIVLVRVTAARLLIFRRVSLTELQTHCWIGRRSYAVHIIRKRTPKTHTSSASLDLGITLVILAPAATKAGEFRLGLTPTSMGPPFTVITIPPTITRNTDALPILRCRLETAAATSYFHIGAWITRSTLVGTII